MKSKPKNNLSIFPQDAIVLFYDGMKLTDGRYDFSHERPSSNINVLNCWESNQDSDSF